jgi:hypothetical protein
MTLLPLVGAHAREADLTGFLGDLLRFDQVVGDLLGRILAVQIPDVDVVRAEFRQALVDLVQRFLLGAAFGFGR